jgi:hypothetical protein
MIKYFINKEIDSKVNQWTIEFLIFSAGFKAKKVNKLKPDVNFYYGNDIGEIEIVKKALIIKYQKNISEKLNIDNQNLLQKNEIDFDIISSTRLFLTDEIHNNLAISDFDIHNRLKFNSSYQNNNSFGSTPIVNYYVMLLTKCIEDKLKLKSYALYPKKYKSVIILSHDVDEPFRYAILKDFNSRISNLKSTNKIKYCWLSLRKKLRKILLKGEESYLNFEQIIKTEMKYGFNSTFFFSSKSKFDKKSNFVFDNSYDVSWSDFENIFSLINTKGFEVGLHSSYNSPDELSNFISEKNRLEKYAKRKILGNRQHFWNLGPHSKNTLKMHQEAGLEYDSSLAFNDSPGYRNNVALPYHPFNNQNKTSIKTLQIPNFIMDTNLITNNTINEKNILEKAIHLIQELEKSKGVASLNWHVRMAYPNDPKLAIYGKTYINILKHLSSKKDIWVTSFENYYKWYCERRNSIEALK